MAMQEGREVNLIEAVNKSYKENKSFIGKNNNFPMYVWHDGNCLVVRDLHNFQDGGNVPVGVDLDYSIINDTYEMIEEG